MSKQDILIIIDGENVPHRHTIKDAEVKLGRSKSNDIVLDDEAVSRKHFRIKREDGKYVVVDLGSTNGVFIEDKRLHPKAEVEWQPKQILRAGPFYLSWQHYQNGNGNGTAKNGNAHHSPEAMSAAVAPVALPDPASAELPGHTPEPQPEPDSAFSEELQHIEQDIAAARSVATESAAAESAASIEESNVLDEIAAAAKPAFQLPDLDAVEAKPAFKLPDFDDAEFENENFADLADADSADLEKADDIFGIDEPSFAELEAAVNETAAAEADDEADLLSDLEAEAELERILEEEQRQEIHHQITEIAPSSLEETPSTDAPDMTEIAFVDREALKKDIGISSDTSPSTEAPQLDGIAPSFDTSRSAEMPAAPSSETGASIAPPMQDIMSTSEMPAPTFQNDVEMTEVAFLDSDALKMRDSAESINDSAPEMTEIAHIDRDSIDLGDDSANSMVEPTQVAMMPERRESVSTNSVLTVRPAAVIVELGQHTEVEIEVNNPTNKTEEYSLLVEDLPRTWFELSQATVKLNPQERKTVILGLNIPEIGARAGVYNFNVFAEAASNPLEVVRTGGELEIRSHYDFEFNVSHDTKRDGAVYYVSIHNKGNENDVYHVDRVDGDDTVDLQARNWDIALPPESKDSLRIVAVPMKRPLFGKTRHVPIELQVTSRSGYAQNHLDEVEIKPRLSLGMLVWMLIALILGFAFVWVLLTYAIGVAPADTMNLFNLEATQIAELHDIISAITAV